MLAPLLLTVFCVVRIPLTLTDEGMPKVTATIEGKEFETWVDLGRSIALIQENKIPKSVITPTGVVVNSQAFNDVIKKENEVKISSLKLGSFTFIDVKGTLGTDDLPSYTITSTKTSSHRDASPPLMLGNDIFTNGVLLVDYKGGFFEYGKNISEFTREVPFQKWAFVPFKLDKGQIQFLALTKGLSGHWILDSGATINLIYKGFFGPLKFTQADDQVLNLGRFSFTLDNVYYTNKALKTGIFGIVGAPFLKKYRILIDFRKNHLYIEP